jgi:tripartite-type tricarboxylate transporter receptor subunit TctC
MNRIVNTAAALFAGAVGAGPCIAQSYPAKPVRIVSPFPAGGGTDIVARLIARQIGESMGQSFIVENRIGAAGMIGCEAVARSAPDGYNLLMGTIGTHATNPAVFSKMSYDPIRDFAPVSLVAALPFVLVVHPSIPARNVKELVALAKARPEALNYASSGIGGIAHLGFVLLNTMAGTRMTHVPYKGSPLQTQATVAGEIAMTLDSIAVTQPFVKAGRIRALGIGAVRRSPLMPEVPTIAEAGLPGYELLAWYALFAPAATSPDIVRVLQREVVKGLAGRNVAQDFGALGAEPVGSTSEELAGVVQRDLKKWAKVAQDAGVKAD